VIPSTSQEYRKNKVTHEVSLTQHPKGGVPELQALLIWRILHGKEINDNQG